MESVMKTTLLLSVLAASALFAAPAGALTGGPAQFMPPYPYPSYCKYCIGSRYVEHHRLDVERRHVRGHAIERAPK
jgi:hypothetical protein